MASCGFYFTPKKDHTDCATCFGCNKAQSGWDQDTHPCASHLQQSPECPISTVLLASSLRGSDPDFDWSVNPDFCDPKAAKVVALIRATYGESWPYDKPKYKNHPSSDTLAAAGMFYNPMYVGDDTVTCLYCGSGLEGWEEDDNPVNEHRRRVPQCYFFQSQMAEPVLRGTHKRFSSSAWDKDLSLEELGSIEDNMLFSELSLEEHALETNIPTIGGKITKSPTPTRGVPKVARRRTNSSRPSSSAERSSLVSKTSSPLRAPQEHKPERVVSKDSVGEVVEKEEVFSGGPEDTRGPVKAVDEEPDVTQKVTKKVAFSDDDLFDISIDDYNDESYVEENILVKPVSRSTRSTSKDKPQPENKIPHDISLENKENVKPLTKKAPKKVSRKPKRVEKMAKAEKVEKKVEKSTKSVQLPSEDNNPSLISLLSSDLEIDINMGATSPRQPIEDINTHKANSSRIILAEDKLEPLQGPAIVSPERKPVPPNFDLLNSVKAVVKRRLPSNSPADDRRNPDISEIFAASPSKSELADNTGSPLKSEMKSSSSIDPSTIAMSPVKFNRNMVSSSAAMNRKPLVATLPSSPPQKAADDDDDEDDGHNIRTDDHLLLTDDSVILEDFDYKPSEVGTSTRPVTNSTMVKPSSEITITKDIENFNATAKLLTSPEAQSTPPGGMKKSIFKQTSSMNAESPTPLKRTDLKQAVATDNSHVSNTSAETSLLKAVFSGPLPPLSKAPSSEPIGEMSKTAEGNAETNVKKNAEENAEMNAKKNAGENAEKKAETKDVLWDAGKLSRPADIKATQRMASAYLDELIDGPAESLYNDPYGELTHFINSVPEHELDMTLRQWIEYDARRAKTEFLKNTNTMIDELNSQIERAKAHLNTLKC